MSQQLRDITNLILSLKVSVDNSSLNQTKIINHLQVLEEKLIYLEDKVGVKSNSTSTYDFQQFVSRVNALNLYEYAEKHCHQIIQIRYN